MLTPENAAKRRAIYERLNQVSGVIRSLKNDVLMGQFDHLSEAQFDGLQEWFNEMVTGFRQGAERERHSQTINEQFDRMRAEYGAQQNTAQGRSSNDSPISES